MYAMIDRLMPHYGTTPPLEYALVGGLLAVIVLFLVRPRSNY